MTLQFNAVSVSWRRRQIISDATFTAPEGKITALIGLNGAGKSTLLRCLTGEKTDYQGNILLDGQDVRRLPPMQRARLIACLPQVLPDPPVTVQELAAFGRAPYTPLSGRLREEDARIVAEAIESAGMTAHAHDRVDRLSGGERRKAFIAMTLAQCTPVIALDEPAAHLDAVSRFALADLITGLCRATGKTILTVMHDLPEVLRLADHIAVLHEGHVVFEGTPQEFLQQEIHRRVYRLEINGSVETGYAVLPYSKNPSA